jgi:dihydroxy-acid dehydratase
VSPARETMLISSDMVGNYTERYMNFGLTCECVLVCSCFVPMLRDRSDLAVAEVKSKNKPIIGIAQTGSDLAPCNQHHVVLVKRVRDGIIAAGGTPFEFPCHPIQESGKRPTASLDRNLAYLSLVEVLFGYPLDGVVLLTGCDKT